MGCRESWASMIAVLWQRSSAVAKARACKLRMRDSSTGKEYCVDIEQRTTERNVWHVLIVRHIVRTIIVKFNRPETGLRHL